MIKPQLPHRSSTSSVVFWFLILLSILLSFLFSSLFLFSGWASNIESFGGFHVFWGAIVLHLLFVCLSGSCRLLALVFALREGVALNLKALLLSRSLSALLIDTLNLLG